MIATNDNTTADPSQDAIKTQPYALVALEPSTDACEAKNNEAPVITEDNTDKTNALPKRWPRSFWFFHIPHLTTKHPIFALIIILGITGPLLWQFFNMVPTSDDNLVYLRGSPSLIALTQMKQDFPLGKLSPYSIIISTESAGSVLTSDYFKVENNLIHNVLNAESPKYINTKSISALSFFGGNDVSFSTAMSYFNSSASVYNSSIAGGYRLLAGGLMNSRMSASLVAIETTINPNSQEVVDFIRNVRILCSSSAASSTVNGGKVQMFLFGGYTATLDIQDALYKLVPMMISVTVIVVFFFVSLNFGSVMLSLRLVFTVLISLSWTFGLMVAVYQPGDGQDAFAVLTPSLKTSSGIYWIIPVMSFSILVGLALDYDIFLVSRLIEFRKMGWSDRAAMCLAIEKTGGIITAAGLIMSISFAGLLIPESTVLNQYGFALFIGVAIDTFVVRTVIVPIVVSLISLHPSANWWPTVMPPVLMSEVEEDVALMAGYWEPPVPKRIEGSELQLLKSIEVEHVNANVEEPLQITTQFATL